MSDFLTAISQHLDRAPSMCACGHPSVLHADGVGCLAGVNYGNDDDDICPCAHLDRELICIYPSTVSREDAEIDGWIEALKAHDWDEDATIATLAAEAPGLTPVEAIRRRLDHEDAAEGRDR